MPKVLVTGSSGHLGCALVLILPLYGYEPLGLDILPSATTKIVGSIADRAFVERIFAEHKTSHVLHAATLHKPHVGSHAKEEFVKVNISGTLNLLEAAAKANCEAFIYTSTTSTFGRALAPKVGEPAAWIDESVVPIPKNIYGTTKIAAEDLCELVHHETKMPVIVLRTSRFFSESDDVDDMREAYEDDNLKVNELTYRRVDIADVVTSHVCALNGAADIKWGKYIISAPTLFQNTKETLALLDGNALMALKQVCPAFESTFSKKNWQFLPRLDRVYDSSKAMRELGWQPVYTFQRAVERISEGQEWRSDLTLKVGKKGYHAKPTGIYTSK